MWYRIYCDSVAWRLAAGYNFVTEKGGRPIVSPYWRYGNLGRALEHAITSTRGGRA